MRKNIKEEYSRFRREADKIYPHLEVDERDQLAMHNALTHVGFHKRAVPLPKLTLHTWLQIITILLTLIFLLIFVLKGHAEPEPTNAVYDQALRALILRPSFLAQTITPPVLFKFDASSNLDVNCIAGCSAAASFSDNAAFTAGTTAISITGGWFSNSPTACTSGSACAPSLTSDRKLFVQAFQGTSPWVVSASGNFGVTQQTSPWVVSASGNFGVTQQTTPWLIQGNIADGSTTETNILIVGGESNDATAQYQPVPLGTAGRSVIVEGVASGTAVPVSGTVSVTNFANPLPVSESGTWTNRVVGNAGAAFDSAQATAAPANNLAVGCTFNNQTGTTSALTAGNLSSIQCDSHGLALIDLQSEAGTAITNTPTAIGTKGSGNVMSVNADLTSVAGTATVTSAAGVQKVGIVGNANAALDAVVTAATAPANGLATLVENVTTAPSLTTGQTVAAQADYEGSLFVKPYRRGQTVTKATTIASSSSATTVLAAQASGIFADISNLIITVTPAASTDLAFTATLSDGTNSFLYDMDTGALATATADPTTININFNPPLPATTAATAWTITLSVATVTVHITVVAVLQKAS